MRPCQAAKASTAISSTLVGIGVPSKYLTLSLPADSALGGDVVARQAADAAADEVDQDHQSQPPRRPAA